MVMDDCKGRGLSGNVLKLLAALSMLLDHMGLILFPNVGLLRILGRLAFPVYAFMIAEGCAHTKHRARYFLSVFLLGAACQVVYGFVSSNAYMGILLTFSLSILVVYAMQAWKCVLVDEARRLGTRLLATLGFAAVVLGVYVLTELVRFDYGFWGCMAPVFASLLRAPRTGGSMIWKQLDKRAWHVLTLGICLLILAFVFGGIRFYMLLAIPLLLLYSGKRGRGNMKYFFYVFYPAHLVILECIAYVVG